MGAARMKKKCSGLLPADHWSSADHPPLPLYPHPDWGGGVGGWAGLEDLTQPYSTPGPEPSLPPPPGCLTNHLGGGDTIERAGLIPG